MDTTSAEKSEKRQKGYYLPDDLVRQVAHAAIDLRVKENVFVEQALRSALEQRAAAKAR